MSSCLSHHAVTWWVYLVPDDSLFSTDANGDPSRQIRRMVRAPLQPAAACIIGLEQAIKSLVQSLDEYTARHLTCTGGAIHKQLLRLTDCLHAEPTNNLEQRLQQWKHRFSSRVTQMFSLILEWQIQLEADPDADSKVRSEQPQTIDSIIKSLTGESRQRGTLSGCSVGGGDCGDVL